MIKSKIIFVGAIVITASIIILAISCASQREVTKHEFKVIELPEYYDGRGAIIPAIDSALFPVAPPVKRIDLGMDQISEAERILKGD